MSTTLKKKDKRSKHFCQTNSWLPLNLSFFSPANNFIIPFAFELSVSEWVFFLFLCWGSLQEAQKRMKIKKPPSILVIHLKRFKYIEHLGRNKKLSYRVVFPMELKLMNTVEDPDTEYSLFAVVVHIGTGPNHGHYVSLVKSHNHWLYFDDETVEMIDELTMHKYFGSSQEYPSNTEHGYILFYESLGKSS